MILAPISPGDLADRISILQLKCDRITDPDKLANCYAELQKLRPIWATHFGGRKAYESLVMLLKKLDKANEELWDLEDKARASRYTNGSTYWTMKDKLAMSTILRGITKTNDARAAYKRAISVLLGSELIEEKSHKA